MFYDRFVGLCKERGVSPSAVMVSIGLNKSNATFWKNGSIPKGDTLQKLSDYFGVSVDYLLGNTDTTPADDVFHEGEIFYGGSLKVQKITQNSDGTFTVSFSVTEKGISADALKELLNFMSENSISTDGLFELVEAAAKIAPNKLRTQVTTPSQSLSFTSGRTDPTPPPEGSEGPQEDN